MTKKTMIYQREHPGSAPDVFKNKKISKMKTLITTILLACTIVAFSQTPYKPKALTAKDYKRAEMSMSQNVGALTKNLISAQPGLITIIFGLHGQEKMGRKKFL